MIAERLFNQVADSFRPVLTSWRIIAFFIILVLSSSLLGSILSGEILTASLAKTGAQALSSIGSLATWKIVVLALWAFLVAPYLVSLLVNLLIRFAHIKFAGPLIDFISNEYRNPDPPLDAEARADLQRNRVKGIAEIRTSLGILEIIFVLVGHVACILAIESSAINLAVIIVAIIVLAWIFARHILLIHLLKVAPLAVAPSP